jgi:hypothetical protein
MPFPNHLKPFTFLISFFHIFTNSQTIIPVQYRENNGYQILASANKPHLNTLFTLDTSTDYSLITTSYLKIENSKIQPITVKSNTYECKIINSSFYSNEPPYTETPLPLALVIPTPVSNLEQNILGLGYKPINIKYEDMFIPKLYINNIIPKPSFTFGPFTTSDSRKLYLGGTPPKLQSNQYKTKLNVVNTTSPLSHWAINMKSFSFITPNHHKTLYTYPNTHITHINIADDRFFVPYSVMKFINETIFKEYFSKGKCNQTYAKTRWYINCDCSITSTFPDLLFNIDDKAFILTPNQSFIKVSGGTSCLFIMQNNYLENNDLFFIGNFFIRNITTEFDYNEKAIFVYSSFPISDIAHMNKVIIIKDFFIVTSLCLILNTICLMIFNKK